MGSLLQWEVSIYSKTLHTVVKFFEKINQVKVIERGKEAREAI